jgi:hypothetical protein
MWKAGMLFFSKRRGEVSSYFVANRLSSGTQFGQLMVGVSRFASKLEQQLR